jgi:Bacterial SH3 domain
VVALLLTSCSVSFGGTPTPATAAPVGSATPSPSAPPLLGSTRTVLAQLGLNIHSSPSTAAHVVAVAAQGTTLTVLAYQPGNGGWYQVRGQTVTGWIVAAPSLTAQGLFTGYQSSEFGFNVLYPQSWTFSQQASGVVFRPQQGNLTIVVRTGSTPASFGAGAPPGYISTFSEQLVVCGYTGTLLEYQLAAGAPTPTPSISGVVQLPQYASIVLRFDATHAMAIQFNYSSNADLGVFQDFYNSLSMPYPLCEQVAIPSPTAGQ